MDWFNVAQRLADWIWHNSFQASVVILIVLVAQWLLRNRLSPAWRHALWVVVLIRLLIPTSVASPVSLFNWIRTPRVGMERVSALPQAPELSDREEPVSRSSGPLASSPRSLWGIGGLAAIWGLGFLGMAACLAAASIRLGRHIRCRRPVTRSDVLGLLEDCKQQMGVTTPLTLIETPAVQSPALLGFIRPRLLLPVELLRSFSLPELRYVFLHELAHLKRGDIPLNWMAVVPLLLHWFNPLVWYAFFRMRADGELACDALALSHTPQPERKQYGATIIKLLDSFNRPAIAPGMVGILENQNQMKWRIRMIAAFSKNRGMPVVASALFVGLSILTLTDAQPTVAADTAKPAAAAGPPRVVSTNPAIGAAEVDPGLAEITVTFDRDMAGGFSWTGGGPDYPPGRDNQKPRWIDQRTCALPVTLGPGRYYRVGINSTSYQNFRSANGVPAQPAAVYFTTRGATPDVKNRAARPAIVEMKPANGATSVDPATSELRVTFNVPMGGGFSWTGGGEQYPTIPEGKRPHWTADKMTCVLPVQLQPGKSYRLGLNSPSHRNFQSAGGIPLEPVVYTFQTR